MLKILGLFCLFISSLCILPNDECAVEKCISCPNSTDICDECSPEYYLTSNNTCDDCTINCAKCSGPEVSDCQQCINKYALDDDGLCMLTDIENCLKLNFERTECRECIKGYSFNGDDSCIERECKVAGCTSCPDKDTECRRCNDEYFLTNKTCGSCAVNCRICTDDKVEK